MHNKDDFYNKVTNKIIEIESEYNLLDMKINNVYAWQVARINIYTQILDSVLSKGRKDVQKEKKKHSTFTFRRFFINSVIYNPFLSIKKKQVLIFESGRKYWDGEKYIDIYTKYIHDKLSLEGVSTSLYETNGNWAVKKGANKEVKHIDSILILSKINKLFIKISVPNNLKNKLLQVQYILNNEFDVNLDLISIIVDATKQYKSQYPFFLALFKLKRPKEIYLVNSTDKSALISAAKDQNIIVNELQHGLISQSGIVGYYPHIIEDSLRYFPDRFYLWKDLDLYNGKLPLSKKNIRYMPCGHLNMWKNKTRRILKDDKSILVISQPYNSIEIQDFILRNIKEMNDYSFIYKFHPLEDKKALLQFQERMKINDNIVFYFNDVSIYELMKKSKFVIGIFSTGLNESIHFGCDVLILDLPGSEHLSSLIDKGKALLIDPKNKLSDYIIKN